LIQNIIYYTVLINNWPYLLNILFRVVDIVWLFYMRCPRNSLRSFSRAFHVNESAYQFNSWSFMYSKLETGRCVMKSECSGSYFPVKSVILFAVQINVNSFL
jgi:hypothetical protein